MNLASRYSYLAFLSCIDQFAPITRGNRSHIISSMKATDAFGGLLLVQVVGAGHNARLTKLSPRGELLSLRQNLHMYLHSIESSAINL